DGAVGVDVVPVDRGGAVPVIDLVVGLRTRDRQALGGDVRGQPARLRDHVVARVRAAQRDAGDRDRLAGGGGLVGKARVVAAVIRSEGRRVGNEAGFRFAMVDG